MYLCQLPVAKLRRHKKGSMLWLGLIGCFVFLYWCWAWEPSVVHTGTLGWVESRGVLSSQAWRHILARAGNITAQGCTLPVLDPWGKEVLQYVSSVPEVRYQP